MVIRIVKPGEIAPVGKLADAELHFEDGPLAGLKLVGFAVWQQGGQQDGRVNVTFPTRQYTVRGEQRRFVVLRPVADGSGDALRKNIEDAYRAHAAKAATTPERV